LISGERSVDVPADPSAVWDVLVDVGAYAQWQGTVREVKVLERDDEGRPALVESRNDAKVKTLRLVLRYAYEDGREISWRYEDGDVKDLHGSYVLEDLGGSTRVTYALEVDPGRRLGLLLRGPVVDQIRDRILNGTLDELAGRVASA
jgi:ribosome-associated toxin RatA of RatAB toxin-antitoxin module